MEFIPDEKATAAWRDEVVRLSLESLAVESIPEPPAGDMTRGEFVQQWWAMIRDLPLRSYNSKEPGDADADGIPDEEDALMFSADQSSLVEAFSPEAAAAYAGHVDPRTLSGQRFNFTGEGSAVPKGFTNDHGHAFTDQRGFGWSRDMRSNHRRRDKHRDAAYDTFLFTRAVDQWEYAVENGRYEVTLCVGDSGHEQLGHIVVVESVQAVDNRPTVHGRFIVKTMAIDVRDGRLTIEIGNKNEAVNTCLNWLVVQRDKP